MELTRMAFGANMLINQVLQVKKGETATSIAKKYGLSVEELRRINNLSPKAVLSPGQKLIVSPGGKN